MLKRLGSLAAATAVFGSLCAVGVAGANETGSGGSDRAKPVEMRMEVTAKRFVVDGEHAYARGPLTVRATDEDGVTRTLQRRVNLRVKGAGPRSCKILTLRLAELYVDLLGLEVRTSEINLRITGVPNKALGKLFCKLSKGLKLNKKKLTRRAAHSLNRRIAGEELHVVRFNARLHPQSYQGDAGSGEPTTQRAPEPDGPRCEILDLDLGPLELDLLGLVVELYGKNRKSAVHVDADADPNGGILGETLCQIAGEPSGSEEPPPQQ